MLVNGKELKVKMNEKIYHCAMDITMDYLGGKWKSIVLWYLRKEKKRFSELKKHIPDITEKMLSLQLKQLESQGIIGRKVYAEVPPKVEYFLTDEGKTLIPALEEIAKWGRYMAGKHGEMIESETLKKPKKKAVK